MKRQRILCPTDFSDAANAALGSAFELAADGARIDVVHVFQVPIHSTPPISQQLYERAQQALADLVAEQRPGAGIELSSTLLEGPVAETLVEHARKQGSELIVMTTHGRQGMAHALLGSVAERVMRLSDCPVFVLPAG